MQLTVQVSDLSVEIRLLERSDDAAVQDVIDACGSTILAALSPRPAARDVHLLRLSVPRDGDPSAKEVHALHLAGRPIGVVEALRHFPRSGECTVRVFAVVPDLQHRGIGTAVATAMVGSLRRQGVTDLHAWFDPADTGPADAIRRFLAHLGFAETGPAPAVAGHPRLREAHRRP